MHETLIVLVSIVITYCIVGISMGVRHTLKLLSFIKGVKERETFLREMVKMYEFTPAGAEHYAELQRLYVSNKEALEEYEVYNKNKASFVLVHVSLCSILWPYYMKEIHKQKAVGK